LTFNPESSSSDIVASSLLLVVEVEKYFWFLALLTMLLVLRMGLVVAWKVLLVVGRMPFLQVVTMLGRYKVEDAETRGDIRRAPRVEAR
jgi:Ca2+/Na+ antiporter